MTKYSLHWPTLEQKYLLIWNFNNRCTFVWFVQKNITWDVNVYYIGSRFGIYPIARRLPFLILSVTSSMVTTHRNVPKTTYRPQHDDVMILALVALLLAIYQPHLQGDSIPKALAMQLFDVSDSKVHGANIRPAWVLSFPGGPHVGPMNPAIRGVLCCYMNKLLTNSHPETSTAALIRQHFRNMHFLLDNRLYGVTEIYGKTISVCIHSSFNGYYSHWWN